MLYSKIVDYKCLEDITSCKQLHVHNNIEDTH